MSSNPAAYQNSAVFNTRVGTRKMYRGPKFLYNLWVVQDICRFRDTAKIVGKRRKLKNPCLLGLQNQS